MNVDMSDVINPMTQEECAEWCDALESGRYAQGHGYLKDDHGGFCCLGVEQEIHPTQCAPVNDTRTLKRLGESSDDLDTPRGDVRLPGDVQSVCWRLNDVGGGAEGAAGTGVAAGLAEAREMGIIGPTTTEFPDIARFLRARVLPNLPTAPQPMDGD